ncbi:unnamed protein product [Dovyalis caffra]|uniref:thiamine diphosphokinase n=1 Tax=Dovyalis caffra TaxID=77055 RepID=A0AAV1SDP8_9ROSI|nr:unnamed protein product [Dovyalis caffra]
MRESKWVRLNLGVNVTKGFGFGIEIERERQTGELESVALSVLPPKRTLFRGALRGRERTARVRVCADGGANRVFDEMPRLIPSDDALDVRHSKGVHDASCQSRLEYKPDVIKGDMDSIRTEVLDFYANLGTEVIDESHDQDTTDLHKCVAYIRDFTPNLDKSNLCILVTGALGGRFDHEAGNINVLYRFSTMRLILLSDDCLIYLLPRTHRHEINIQSSVEGPHCGLIPIGMPSVSTTTGLRWNLSKYIASKITLVIAFVC